MTYSVVYHRRAEDELARLWLIPGNRAAVNAAVSQIDQILKHSPADAGESRPHGRRILLVSPLGVKFEVFEQQHLVRVLDLWRYEKRGKS